MITTEPLSRILTFTFPKLQRNLVVEHIEAMVEDQKREYDSNGCFSMLQSITVASHNGDLMVLDGQHRIKAYAKLHEEGYPINDVILPVVIYHVKDKDELMQYFQKINKNMPIHPFETEETWETVGKYICTMMEENFKNYVKACNGVSKSCRCPHISMYELKSHIQARNVVDKLREYNKTVYDFWKAIISINMYVSREVKAHIQLCSKSMKRIQECDAKANKHKCQVCYLGIWRRFEWLDIALYIISKGAQDMNELYINLSEFSEVRCRVPFHVREQVWKKIHNNVCDEGICFCCDSTLKFPDMECGHIVAHALGGKACVQNFMPVCKTCNRDMGIMNLYEYKMMLTNMMHT
jgi:hypothetical protein